MELPDASKTPSQSSKPAALKTRQPSVTKTIASPSAPSISDNGLNSQAPWLIIASENSLWAANPDGSGLQKIVENRLATKLGAAIQPGGSRVAVITSDSDQIHNMALSLVTLPAGNVEKITDLTSSQTEKSADANPGEPEFEAISAVNQADMAWSPDGKKLAFIGLMDGPSADLYLYDTTSKKISRVTKDSSQNYQPIWSPDGKNIIVFGVESFGTGGGLTMAGVWLVKGDGSNVKPLYDPKNSSGEIIIGWRGNTTAILTSWGMDCGEYQLRLFDISNAQTTIIQKDCTKAAASPTGTILYGDGKALYLLSSGGAEGKKEIRVAEGETNFIRWDTASSIFIAGLSGGKLITFDTQGKNQQETPEDNALNAAARNGVWAWTSYNEPYPGVIISGPGMETGQIFTKNADVPIFDANKNLLFFADKHLYRSTPPLYEFAIPLGAISDVQEVIWLGEK